MDDVHATYTLLQAQLPTIKIPASVVKGSPTHRGLLSLPMPSRADIIIHLRGAARHSLAHHDKIRIWLQKDVVGIPTT